MKNVHDFHGRTDEPSRSETNVGAVVNALFAMRQFEYGSQIKEPAYKPNVLAALQELATRGFSIGQWNYALS